jgi:hypothetical protein
MTLPLPERQNEYCRRAYAKLRAKALTPYGDTCACCSSTENLTLDHIAGDGQQHRQVFTSSAALYRWIVANGHPAGFQILCGSCNRSKGRGPVCKLNHALIGARKRAEAKVQVRVTRRLEAEVLRLRAENEQLRRELEQLRGAS